MLISKKQNKSYTVLYKNFRANVPTSHLGLHLQMENIIGTLRDSNLKLTLAFGIGMHHAGLHERDRKTVEELFVNCKVQVLCFP